MELARTNTVHLRLASAALVAHQFASIADLSEHVKRACVAHRIAYDGPTMHRALALLTAARPLRVAAPVSALPRDQCDVEAPLSRHGAREVLARLFAGCRP